MIEQPPTSISGSQLDLTRIAIIVGIRSQFMKAVAFQHSIHRWNNESTAIIEPVWINSGQHYTDSLSATFFREFDLRFHVDLTNSYSSIEPIHMLSEMISKLYNILKPFQESLDWVIVFGDANTTLAGTIAAAKCKLPIAHIEAGVRSNLLTNFEEQNRIVADHLATIRFASSQRDVQNLVREGLVGSTYWVGDLIYDLISELLPNLGVGFGSLPRDEYVLATLHREENLSQADGVQTFMQTLSRYHRPVLFVSHPRTRRRLDDLGLLELPNITFVWGLPYLEMLSAINGCAFLVTDSGALQRESYYLRKRCLIRQDMPFWPTFVEVGVHHLIDFTRANIEAGLAWIESEVRIGYIPIILDFGDGRTGQKILEHLSSGSIIV